MHAPHTTFRPSLWRCYLGFLIPALLGVLTAVILDGVTDNALGTGAAWLRAGGIGLACFLLGGLLGTVRRQDRLMITVSNDHISGPGAWGWRRVSFPLQTLDRGRSCAPTVFQRVGGYRYLWSTDGHKILVTAWAFDQAEVTRLLTHIDCIKEQSSS